MFGGSPMDRDRALPRWFDALHYIQMPVERPSLATKRLRAAEIEAKEQAKQLQFASLEIDVHGLLQSHVPVKAPPRLEQPSSVSIEDLSVEQETLVQLHLEKLKAVHDLEVAQKRRIQLQQVVSAAQLQYKTDDASHRMLTRATELCEVYNATIDVSRALIVQCEKAFLPLATQVDQLSETSVMGAPPVALVQVQRDVLDV